MAYHIYIIFIIIGLLTQSYNRFNLVERTERFQLKKPKVIKRKPKKQKPKIKESSDDITTMSMSELVNTRQNDEYLFTMSRT